MTATTYNRRGTHLVGAAVLAIALLAPMLATAGPWGVLVSEDGKQRFELKKASVIVGTSKRANVRLRHPTVAKKHVKLTHKGGVVKVHELGSRTGTLVAGAELKKGQSKQLFQRTLLSLGAKNLYFEWGDRGKLIKPLRKAKPKADKKPPAAAPTKKNAKSK